MKSIVIRKDDMIYHLKLLEMSTDMFPEFLEAILVQVY